MVYCPKVVLGFSLKFQDDPVNGLLNQWKVQQLQVFLIHIDQPIATVLGLDGGSQVLAKLGPIHYHP
jgi:hypothetical protein